MWRGLLLAPTVPHSERATSATVVGVWARGRGNALVGEIYTLWYRIGGCILDMVVYEYAVWIFLGQSEPEHYARRPSPRYARFVGRKIGSS